MAGKTPAGKLFFRQGTGYHRRRRTGITFDTKVEIHVKSFFSRIVISSIILFASIGAAHAQGPKIAVLDMAGALLNTEQAQKVDAEIAAETAEDQKKIRDIATQAQGLQERLQKDAAVLSDAEKKKLSDEIQELGVQYQYLVQKLQATLQERRDQFQQALAPSLIQAIQAVVEEEKYDIVLRAEGVLHYGNAYDITAKVTERLNKLQ